METSEYLICPVCGDEVTEDEVGTLHTLTSWVDDVCYDCIDRYERKLQDFLNEARSEFDSGFLEGVEF